MLLIYRGTTLPEGNQRVATQKPMDVAQLLTLHGDITFCPFLDVSISIFKGPGRAAFICILQNISSLKAGEAKFLIILMGLILVNTEVRGKFYGDHK